ncbi:MAG: FAD-binding oxidoreductase [Rhodospirillales bacterium]|nr:FAD-binding oxidoreductase [Rhodospirillales bacterium]
MPQPEMENRYYDVIICGGGMIGSALAFGLSKSGVRILMLDEGDTAFRAARGNFGLVWFQGKGVGMQAYRDWTHQSVDQWPGLAAELLETTGIDVRLRQSGGLDTCLGEQEFEDRQREIDIMKSQSPDGHYPVRMVDRKEAEDILGNITLGERVLGAMYSTLDGHVNPLSLLHAFHAGFQSSGGHYQANAPVREIAATGKGSGEGYTVSTDRHSYACSRVVISAGLGIPPLARSVGLDVPVYPERGQILVTERTAPFLTLPTLIARQTEEGSVMIGVSNEDAGFDAGTTGDMTASIAKRALDTFPVLASLNLVRTWGALRVLTPDHAPVYDQSRQLPGIFVSTSHSGVTLAAANVACAAEWILENRPPDAFHSFTTDRFNVDATKYA